MTPFRRSSPKEQVKYQAIRLHVDREPTPEEAMADGRAARRRMLEIGACPYTADPDDDERIFNIDACRYWRRGWKAELDAQFAAAMAPGPQR